MKNRAQCVKCDSRDLVRIPGVRGGYGAGNVIPTGGLTIWSSIVVTRYVCVACGYSEEWIDSEKELECLHQLAKPPERTFLQSVRTALGKPLFE